MRIEGSPFSGWFTSFGGNSTDSVVGLLHSGSRYERERGLGTQQILKYNRQPIQNDDHTLAAAEFKRKSLELYRSALGDMFVTDTEIRVGSKKDHGIVKPKVYQLQPMIKGISAKEASEEIRQHPWVKLQWDVLGERLFHLYATAREVNAEFPEEERFPITMTIGSSRQNAQYLENSAELPLTKNIMIKENSRHLVLFDYGEYAMWNKHMMTSYETIFSRCQLPQKGEVFNEREYLAQAVV